MNIVAKEFLYRCGSRVLRERSSNILRMSFGSGESCSPPPPCPCPPPKPEPAPCDPEPPPCPKLPPPCPPPLCAKVPDPGNPCNYCPPPCIDPDYPDLRRLKKNQCKFQIDNGLPIYLRGGQLDAVLYQATLILTILSLVCCFYIVFTKFD